MGLAWEADYHRQTGSMERAEEIARVGLEGAQGVPCPMYVSQYWRILGDVASGLGQQSRAAHFYDEAVGVAHRSAVRWPLVESLLSRGRWRSRHSTETDAALDDLVCARLYARSSGYGLLEADTRLALAGHHLSAGDHRHADMEAQRARSQYGDGILPGPGGS
jgi:hypothetical protein